MNNYISTIRSKIGSDKFIHPGARILVEDKQGRFLFIERVDNGKIGLPAGGLEENETIETCIIREVKEETGLDLLNVEVIGISSSPQRETVEYPNGDKIQYFTIEFYSNSFNGNLQINDAQEVKKVGFKDKSYAKYLPLNERGIFESLAYYKKHNKIKLL